MLNEVCVSSDFSRAVYSYLNSNYNIFKSGIYQTTKKIYTSMDFKYLLNEKLPISYNNLPSLRVHNFLDFWALYKLNDESIFENIIEEYLNGKHHMLIIPKETINAIRFLGKIDNDNDKLVDYALVTIVHIGKKMALLNCDFMSTID